MNQHSLPTSTQNSMDRPLLTAFLLELKIVCRNLGLYPEEHPQIAAGLNKALKLLDRLLQNFDHINLGITPNGLYFDQIKLDDQEQVHKDFASFFYELGIAAIDFQRGTSAGELLRLCLLLQSDQRQTQGPDNGKLEALQQLEHIGVISVDYSVFQSGEGLLEPEQQQLWEDFLHGLQLGILDFGTTENAATLTLVADILSKKFSANQAEGRQCQQALDQYVEKNLLTEQGAGQDHAFNALLLQLDPAAQRSFLESALQLIDSRPQQAESALQKLSPQLLQSSLAAANASGPKISPRLIKLIETLNSSVSTTPNSSAQLNDETPDDVVRARLKTLFAEEHEDLYLPDNYQQALSGLLTDDLNGHMSEEEKKQLKADMEEHSIEHQFAAVIFELLQNPLTQDQEKSIQENLLDLSRFFIDTGDFISLRTIYRNWSRYLNSTNSSTDIFDETLLASHTQLSFMNEILDSFDLWGEDKQEQLCTYVAQVGPAYCDLLIERLGLAPGRNERRMWMKLLKAIGGDTRQMISDALNDEPWYLLRNLLMILAGELTPATIQTIQKYADHPHPKVRSEVIRALFRCNPATANRLLLRELHEDDPQVRLCAYELVGLSRDPAVSELLHRQLEVDSDSDEQALIAAETVALLGRLGRAETLPIFRRLLMSRKKLFRSRHEKALQQQIIASLSGFAAPAATKLLEELTRGPHKQAARKALQERQEQP